MRQCRSKYSGHGPTDHCQRGTKLFPTFRSARSRTFVSRRERKNYLNYERESHNGSAFSRDESTARRIPRVNRSNLSSNVNLMTALSWYYFLLESDKIWTWQRYGTTTFCIWRESRRRRIGIREISSKIIKLQSKELHYRDVFLKHHWYIKASAISRKSRG